MAENPTRILTVTELNRLAHDVLERSFPLIWISGEISNFTRAASGHWYFSLKDSTAQVRCAMFKGRNSYIGFTPREGDKIEARATVTLYEARGDFQLTVEFMQKAGLGVLFEAYERLKAKLQAEGLFDANRKKAIPAYPESIGIITSPDAAALRDVLSTLKRRAPHINLFLYPTAVQGKGVAQQIADAIASANRHAQCDVIILCRGGGSIEDLWQFNEEVVARAIANSQIPIISGVGHETDFTIADFAADLRAPTPTAAAEIASPELARIEANLQARQQQLAKLMTYTLNRHHQHLDYLSKQLLSPALQIQHKKNNLIQLETRLKQAISQRLQLHQLKLENLSQSLAHLNPNSVLKRGYALIRNENGAVVHSSKQLKSGQTVHLTLGEGTADAEIKQARA